MSWTAVGSVVGLVPGAPKIEQKSQKKQSKNVGCSFPILSKKIRNKRYDADAFLNGTRHPSCIKKSNINALQ